MQKQMLEYNLDNNLIEQIKLYTRFVMPLLQYYGSFFYNLGDKLFILGIRASKSKEPKNYDVHLERLVRAIRISVSRNTGIEGMIEEIEGIIKDINNKVTDDFISEILSIFMDFYKEILNNKTPFEKRRDLDSRMLAIYYAGRKAGSNKQENTVDPYSRSYELSQKYNKARDIAEKILKQIL